MAEPSAQPTPVAVESIPPEVAAALAGIQGNLVDVAPSIQGLNLTVAQSAQFLGASLYSPINVAAEKIAAAIRGAPTPVGQPQPSLADSLHSIDTSMQGIAGGTIEQQTMYSDVTYLTQQAQVTLDLTMGTMAQDLCTSLYQLGTIFTGGLADMPSLLTTFAEKLLETALGSKDGPSPAPAPSGAPRPEGAAAPAPKASPLPNVQTIGESILKPILAAAFGGAGVAYTYPAQLAAILNAGVAAASTVYQPLVTELYKGIKAPYWDKVQALLDAGEMTEDRAKGALVDALGIASEEGLKAHAVSMALSLDVLGCLDLNATGLAAMVAEGSGFAPLVNSVHGPLWDAYLGRPWTRRINRALRPTKAGLGDVLDWRRERHQWGDTASTAVPEGFSSRLAGLGYSDEEISNIHESLWNHPSLRQLQVMLDVESAWTDEEWLADKIGHLGFKDADKPYVLDALKRRQTAAYRRRRIELVLDRVQIGELDSEELDAELSRLDLPQHVLDELLALADDLWQVATMKATITEAREKYAKAQIDEGEFRAALDGLGLRTEAVDNIVSLDTVKRYHKVWLLSDVEKARELVSTYRQLYIYGLYTEEEVMSAYDAAGVDYDTYRVWLTLDKYKRDRTVAADLREWRLPAERELVVTGDMTVLAYKSNLEALGFPDSLLAFEVDYTAMLADRARRQRVERNQLPSAEQAYIHDLIGKPTLTRLYEEAGRSQVEITIRFQWLDLLRTEAAAAKKKSGGAGAAGGGSVGEYLAQKEWHYVQGTLAESTLVSAYKMCGKPPDYVTARLKALAAEKAKVAGGGEPTIEPPGGKPSNAAVVAQAEWDYLDYRIDETALVAAYRKADKAPDYVQRRLGVLGKLRQAA